MARRAPNGASSIYLGKDGRWHTWVHAGTKANGKPDRRHVHRATATECKAAADELRERIGRGNAPLGRIETVEDWLAHWLEHDVRPNKAWRTYTGYAGLINNYVIPNIGGWRLDGTRKRLEPEYVQAMYAKMAKTPIVRGSRGKDKPNMLAASTIHKVHWILSSALDAAVRRGKAPRNACALIDPPSFRKTKVAALTLAETQAVVQEALTDPGAARWLTGLLLGPRQGETLGLRWPEVHLDPAAGEEPHIELKTQLQRHTLVHGCADPAGCVTALNAGRRREGKRPFCRTQACPPNWVHGCVDPGGCRSQPFRCPARRVRKGCRLHARKCPPPCRPGCAGHARHCPDRVGGLVEVELKSERSVRSVALPALIVELLRQHRVAQQRLFAERGLAWSPGGLVFTSPEGRPMDAGRDHRAWEALLVRAGVADAKLHAARHTAGTMLIASGADISVVQEVLGHTDIRTARIYVDVAKKTQREAFDRALSAITEGNLAALLQPNAATRGPKS